MEKKCKMLFMNLLSIKEISKIGREKPLFENVTFGLQENQKAALIGRNGSGKSTLLNTIAGVLSPDSGEIVFNREAKIAFLPQEPVFNPADTIAKHIFNSTSENLKIIERYEELCEKMSLNNLSEALKQEYEKILTQMDSKNLWNYESQIKSVLQTLKINDMNRKMSTLSGGMIKKVALAQVLVDDTNILLLDEPTNHLDIQTISYLQDYLAKTKRSVLMVTHDRYFLDSVCTTIYELDKGKIKLYEGNYSSYLEKKETEREILINTERRIESVLRFEREWLLRGPCARGTKIKARIQRDEQLINREKFHEDSGFTFEVKGRRLSGKILELHKISKFFQKGYSTQSKDSDKPVIKNFSYTFSKGQRIGLYGENGSGKTTLLNIITGNLEPDEGYIVKGENTHFGYYTQNLQIKDSSLTVLEYIKETAERMTLNEGKKEVSASRFLEEFGFTGKIQHSPLSGLSGGERKRLYLVRLLLENPNFLILDEPTNDFDIFTMNLIEQFLLNYEGCLLIVSHDRYFMDKIADSLFILENDGSISGFVGKCSEYIELQKEEKKEAALQQEQKSQEQKQLSQQSMQPQPAQKKKLSYKEQREFEELDKEIPVLEAEAKLLEEKMSGTNFEEINKAQVRYKEIESLLEAKYARWEELASLA